MELSKDELVTLLGPQVSAPQSRTPISDLCERGHITPVLAERLIEAEARVKELEAELQKLGCGHPAWPDDDDQCVGSGLIEQPHFGGTSEPFNVMNKDVQASSLD